MKKRKVKLIGGPCDGKEILSGGVRHIATLLEDDRNIISHHLYEF